MRGRCSAFLAVVVDAWIAHAGAAAVPAAMPIEFEANAGQHERTVRYLARAAGYQLYLTSTGPVFSFPIAARASRRPAQVAETIRLEFLHANRAPTIQPLHPSTHRTNYFIGDDPARYHTDIWNFEQVMYRDVYPGVDVLFYGQNGNIEYDLVLQPGADLGRIELAFRGAAKIRIDSSGDLVVTTAMGSLKQRRPSVYQVIAGERTPVAARYRSSGRNRVKLDVARYDAGKPLVIDPVLTYSTYLGGSNTESGQAIAVDATGNAYIAGSTASSNFPAAGGYQRSLAGSIDAYVAKLSPGGTGLVYSTYLGGRQSFSQAMGIAVDASGNAYVTGTTSSKTFPTTAGAFQTAITGGGGFVAKLNAAGNALLYSTYLAGAYPQAIRVDASGSAFLAGYTAGGLPTTAGAFRTTKPSASPNHSGFVTRLNAAGSALLYSTYLGGSDADDVHGLDIDHAGNAYVVGATSSADFPTRNAFQPARKGGKDAFLSKLDPVGSSLVFSTYVGGTADDSANAVAVDAAGGVYIAGDTFSTDFPRYGGRSKGHNDTVANNAFITEFAPDGVTLVGSGYFGGAACLTPDMWSCYPTQPNDGATAIAVDPTGTNIYVAGYLSSVVVYLNDPVQSTLNGPTDAFVARFRKPLNLLYSTRLGGSDVDVANGIAIDPAGNAYVVGTSNGGNDFPATAGAAQVAAGGSYDVFVAKLSTAGVRVQAVIDSSLPRTYELTADVALNANGTITFIDGVTALASKPVINGTASLTTTLALGVHKITAVYSGDGSVSEPQYVVVSQQ